MAERESQLDWSALRDFGVVAEEGSLSEAARRLGVSQSTLTRRMAALEEDLGAEVLRRGPRGVELTETGEAILEPIRRMTGEVREVDLVATGRDATLSGTVRISSTEGLVNHWCTPTLRDFQREHPAIRFELDVSMRNANVLRREADIALRLGRPRQQELVARRGADLRVGLYASTEYLERFGRPGTIEEIANHQTICFDEALRGGGVGAWIEKLLGGGNVVYRATGLMTQLEAVRCGWGIGFSSVFIANEIPELERVVPELEHAIEIWLVTHAGLRRSARIRAVYDFLAERLEADRERLAGRA